MTDFFALLDEARRPWLDSDKLKAKFLSLSTQAHPDRFTTATAVERESANHRFTELNAAFNCLRDPRERLRHLLDLELGERPKHVQEIPRGLMELFTEIARLRREVNAFLEEVTRVQSPLLRVQMFERAQEWMDRLRDVQHRLGERQAALLRELQELDAEWERLGADAVRRRVMLQNAEQIHRQLSFYTRWNAQLQEMTVRISL